MLVEIEARSRKRNRKNHASRYVYETKKEQEEECFHWPQPMAGERLS